MQVFLPVPDITESLKILDNRRLAKQRVEAKQLIDVILGRPTASGKPRKGWSNHPAAIMFRRYLPCLISYYNTSLTVHESRGGNNVKLQPESQLKCDEGAEFFPWWWDDEAIHSSHRSRLLMKGKIDVLAHRIRHGYNVRSVNSWLKSCHFPPLNELRMDHHDKISHHLDVIGCPPATAENYYDQFGWTDDPTTEYSWPGETPEDGIKVLR